jgi:RNA polymerase sigma-70 factor (ECF subfamily)
MGSRCYGRRVSVVHDKVKEHVEPGSVIGGTQRTPEAFADFFEAEYRRLVKALYLLTWNRDEADDLAQEAAVRLYERWDRVRSMSSPVGYLYRTALNLHRSRVRQAARIARRLLTFQMAQDRDPLAAVEDRDELSRVLRALPPSQREVILLTEWLGLNTAEVAQVLGVSDAAVRMRLSRARTFLKQQLGGLDE